MTKILEIAEFAPYAEQVIGDKNAEYVVAKSLEEIPDGQYDVVFSFGDLQKYAATDVPDAVAKMVERLKPMGEIWVYVPSVDHAMSVLEFGGDPRVALWELWGEKEYPHRVGFTLSFLRGLLEQQGVLTRRASQYAVLMPFGEERKKVVYNFVIGVRNGS